MPHPRFAGKMPRNTRRGDRQIFYTFLPCSRFSSGSLVSHTRQTCQLIISQPNRLHELLGGGKVDPFGGLARDPLRQVSGGLYNCRIRVVLNLPWLWTTVCSLLVLRAM